MNQPFPESEQIIVATKNGLIAAREEFKLLTGCDEWEYFINHPEYMISSCMMRFIKNISKNLNVWPEMAPKHICASPDIRDGRVDVVIDDINDKSRVAIEVKTNIGIETDFDRKIKHDIERLCIIVKNPNDSLLNLGLFAFIANRSDSTLKSSLSKIETKVRDLVQSYNLSFTPYISEDIGRNGWEAYAVVYAITRE